MKISNSTEEQYREVVRLIQEVGLKPSGRIIIMANIVGVCTDISRRMSSEEIVRKYDLRIKPGSFTETFKITTGLSIKDIPSIMYRERRRIKADQIKGVIHGIDEEAVTKLLDLLDGQEEAEEQ